VAGGVGGKLYIESVVEVVVDEDEDEDEVDEGENESRESLLSKDELFVGCHEIPSKLVSLEQSDLTGRFWSGTDFQSTCRCC
jgi:subtilase family serine protease